MTFWKTPFGSQTFAQIVTCGICGLTATRPALSSNVTATNHDFLTSTTEQSLLSARQRNSKREKFMEISRSQSDLGGRSRGAPGREKRPPAPLELADPTTTAANNNRGRQQQRRRQQRQAAAPPRRSPCTYLKNKR